MDTNIDRLTSDFVVHTFGCKVNTYDTGLIDKNLKTHGFMRSSDVKKEGQIHVLNTCAVTAEATKEAVRAIRKIKAKDPTSTVVITGCAAQVDTGSFDSLPGVDIVVANSHKGLLPEIIRQYFKGNLEKKVFKSNIFRKEDLELGGGEEKHHTRSFLKIQDGCNSFCSFCIIPYARGKSRSLPASDLIRKINELSAKGYREVVLTGVHIGDYEDSSLSSLTLAGLVKALLEKTKDVRFRLSSLEPIELTDELLELYQDPRLCPHFHMSIQSADTDVLRDMKRKYTEREVISVFERIRKKLPYAFIGMDVIVGFPTETEEKFENTYRNLAESEWSRIHVFPYSERQGTKAAAFLETVAWPKRMERAQKLRELSLHRYQAEALRMQGQQVEVLVLNKRGRGGDGVTENYWPVQFSEGTEITSLAGQTVGARILGFLPSVDGNSEGVLRAELK